MRRHKCSDAPDRCVTLDRSAKKRFGGISPPEHFNASQPASCNLVVALESGVFASSASRIPRARAHEALMQDERAIFNLELP
jgi:hypothetical protein